MSTTCLPLVQKLPEFLEILAPLCHPMPEIRKQWKKENSPKTHLNCDKIFFELNWCVRDTHGLSFRPYISLWPRQSHSTFEPSFPWRSILATEATFTLNGNKRNEILINTSAHISKTIREHLSTVTNPQPFFAALLATSLCFYLWSNAALLSWKSHNTGFTTWSSFAKKPSFTIVALLSLNAHHVHCECNREWHNQ